MNSRHAVTRNVVRNLLGVLGVSVLAAACASGGGAGSAGGSGGSVTIVYGTSSLLYAPLQVAEKQGFFKAAGVEVNLVPSSSGNAALEAAIGGSGEIVASGLSNDVLAAAKGHSLEFFATLASRLPNNLIISTAVAKQKGITPSSTLQQKVAALKGLTIGDTGAGSVTDQVLQWTLRKYGINPKTDVQIVSLGGDSATAVAGLENGRIQALLYPAPTPETLYASGKGELLVNFAGNEMQPAPGYMLGLMASKDFIDSHRATVQDVTKAVSRAETFMHKDPGQAEAALYTYFSTENSKVFRQAYTDELPTIPETSTVDMAEIPSVINFVRQFSPVSNVKVSSLAGPVG
jgi:NitT/TauT family transport system substrate-binding protein